MVDVAGGDQTVVVVVGEVGVVIEFLFQRGVGREAVGICCLTRRGQRHETEDGQKLSFHGGSQTRTFVWFPSRETGFARRLGD